MARLCRWPGARFLSDTNMVQPFWALPILAIAGVELRRVMAFTVVSFAIALVVFGVSLLVLI